MKKNFCIFNNWKHIGKMRQRKWQPCTIIKDQNNKKSQVMRNTWNSVWICEDLLVRLNINEGPIVKSTVKERWKEPVVGSEIEPEITSLQAKYEKLIFCICACWRMSQRVVSNSMVKVKQYWSHSESELKKAHVVIIYRPETGWSNLEQDESYVKISGGPNCLMLKNQRMIWG